MGQSVYIHCCHPLLVKSYHQVMVCSECGKNDKGIQIVVVVPFISHARTHARTQNDGLVSVVNVSEQCDGGLRILASMHAITLCKLRIKLLA